MTTPTPRDCGAVGSLGEQPAIRQASRPVSFGRAQGAVERRGLRADLLRGKLVADACAVGVDAVFAARTIVAVDSPPDLVFPKNLAGRRILEEAVVLLVDLDLFGFVWLMSNDATVDDLAMDEELEAYR